MLLDFAGAGRFVSPFPTLKFKKLRSNEEGAALTNVRLSFYPQQKTRPSKHQAKSIQDAWMPQMQGQ